MLLRSLCINNPRLTLSNLFSDLISVFFLLDEMHESSLLGVSRGNTKFAVKFKYGLGEN